METIYEDEHGKFELTYTQERKVMRFVSKFKFDLERVTKLVEFYNIDESWERDEDWTYIYEIDVESVVERLLGRSIRERVWVHDNSYPNHGDWLLDNEWFAVREIVHRALWNKLFHVMIELGRK